MTTPFSPSPHELVVWLNSLKSAIANAERKPDADQD